MLSGKEIITKKELSDGYVSGKVIYFLCEYVLSTPGTVIIPMYAATESKIHFDAVYLYSFDTDGEKLTRIAALKPTSSHAGRGNVKAARWATEGPLVYLTYNTGWDKAAKASVYDVFRFDPVKKTIAEVKVEEKEMLISRYFAKWSKPVPGSPIVSFPKVWYHVGGLPAGVWGLPPPTDYADLSDRKCRDIIVEVRGDMYLRETALRKLTPSLTVASAKKIIAAMNKRHDKLPRYRQMTYAPYREEWSARLIIEARYGTAKESASLGSALYSKDHRAAGEFLNRQNDVNTRDEDGITPLMIAAYADNTEDMEKLLMRGAALDAPDAQGRTPLMYTVFGNAPHALELLLKRGANLKLETRSGWIAWMFVAGTELRQRYLEHAKK